MSPNWSPPTPSAPSQNLRGVGLDVHDVFVVLENDGVAQFAASWLRSLQRWPSGSRVERR
jgi:hypothetical protein